MSDKFEVFSGKKFQLQNIRIDFGKISFKDSLHILKEHQLKRVHFKNAKKAFSKWHQIINTESIYCLGLTEFDEVERIISKDGIEIYDLLKLETTVLRYFPYLISLNVSNSTFNNDDLRLTSDLHPKLQNICLSNTFVNNINILSYFKELRKISVGRSDLGISVEGFSDRLEFLDLSRNTSAHKTFQKECSFPNLKYLDISQSNGFEKIDIR
ncbi:unnamed protein product [Dimorphilus gyrociliatus]|uniref:Uncharacterized protein n=1 Tax=Dimorphilus gyrociliatus TaxID=2664684 RepID=A0A7I8WB90_9ANNE|nr:unnamed protein product [Dimorphilus gyrociliatus]